MRNRVLAKTCSKCGQLKLRKEFNRDRKKKDGLDYQCASCEREYRAKNRAKWNRFSVESHIRQAYREGWLLEFLKRENIL